MVMEEASSLGLHWNQKKPDTIMAEFEDHISENIAQALYFWTNRVKRARNDTKITKLAKPSGHTKPAKFAQPAKESDDSEYDSDAIAYERKLDSQGDMPLAKRRLAYDQLGGA